MTESTPRTDRPAPRSADALYNFALAALWVGTVVAVMTLAVVLYGPVTAS